MEMQNETKSQRKKVATATIPPELQVRIAAIAAEKEWSLSKVGGMLIRLGLEKLDESKQPTARQATA
jgi:predicted N-acetyltransferase YhbS